LNDIKSQLKQFIADSNNIDYNRALVEAIEVIDKKAEEYNGGWIPCENELPNTSEWHPSVVAKEYLVTYYPDEVTKPWVGIRYFRKDKNDFLTKKEEKIIAWQPLPEPYNPKGE
jgi:hypothetical protein